MKEIALIYTTFAAHDDALAALHTLIDEELAACGNISAPHTAVYPWKGELKEDEEVAVFIKAPFDKKDKLVKRLKKIHPYELPCILEIDAAAIPEYAKWLKQAF